MSGSTEVWTQEKESELGSVTLTTISNVSSVTSSPSSTSVGKFWKIGGYGVWNKCLHQLNPKNVIKHRYLKLKGIVQYNFQPYTSENVVILTTTEAVLKQESYTTIARKYGVSTLVTGSGEIKLISPIWKKNSKLHLCDYTFWKILYKYWIAIKR